MTHYNQKTLPVSSCQARATAVNACCPNSFEEQFNLPSLFDDCGDEHGNQLEVVCQEDDVLIFLGFMKYCAQQPSKMHLASVQGLLFIQVVSYDARLLVWVEMMS